MSDKDKIPEVIMHPEAQAQIDADPELAEAMKKITEDMLNAMQAVTDGRHKDFDSAMRALGYDPQPIEDDVDDE